MKLSNTTIFISYNQGMLRKEAIEALKILGFPLDKKRISYLTSLKNRL